jgi:hypothetical protein
VKEHPLQKGIVIPVNTPHQPGVLLYDNHGNPIIYEDNRKKPEDKVIPPASPFPNAVTAPDPETESNGNWYISPDWWMVILTGLLAILAGCAFIETRKQANAAQGQLDAMKKQMMLDERAWVMPIHFHNEKDGSGYLFVATVKNTGKTPALRMRGAISETFDVNSIPEFDIEPSTPINNAMLPPGNESFVQNFCGISGPNPELAGQTFYLYGTVWYDDIFTNHHWSQFCMKGVWTNANSVVYFEPESRHNSCDDLGAEK